MTRIVGRRVFASIGFALVAGCGTPQSDSNSDGPEVEGPGPSRVQVCGGIAGLPCDAGEYCDLGVGNCCCDFQGTCAVIPEMCTMHFDPVCGCEGKTHSNACAAAAAGVSIDFAGACDSRQ